jgi:hypothetical protein
LKLKRRAGPSATMAGPAGRTLAPAVSNKLVHRAVHAAAALRRLPRILLIVESGSALSAGWLCPRSSMSF